MLLFGMETVAERFYLCFTEKTLSTARVMDEKNSFGVNRLA
jgi:hypothetical protein